MTLTVKILRELIGIGGNLTVTMDDVAGGNTIHVTPEEFLGFHHDRDQFSADYYGVSVSEFREWLNFGGAPLCGAKTKNGSLCKNQLGLGQQSIPDWLSRHRADYCTRHSDGARG